MYWFLMGLAGCFVMAALWVTEKSGHIEDANENGIPDTLENFFGVLTVPQTTPQNTQPLQEKPRVVWRGNQIINGADESGNNRSH